MPYTYTPRYPSTYIPVHLHHYKLNIVVPLRASPELADPHSGNCAFRGSASKGNPRDSCQEPKVTPTPTSGFPQVEENTENTHRKTKNSLATGIRGWGYVLGC